MCSLQNRRNFFAYFRRTEAKARRARSASVAHKGKSMKKTRRLKAVLWDALAREHSIGMNCEVTVKCDD